jgi:hypothetical protein
MDYKKAICLILIVTILLVSGCQMLYDFWPAKISKTAIEYTHHEPNQYNLFNKTVATAKELRSEASDVYITSQLELKYKADLDKERYKLTADFLDLSIAQAEQERMFAIGSLQQPGWLLSGLLTMLPVGTFLVGYRTQRPEDYTEDEVQKIIDTKSPVV